MLRLWHPLAEFPSRDYLTVDGAEAHHLLRVRRIRRGERVEVLTGNGGILKCIYDGPEGRAVRLRIQQAIRQAARPCRLRLAVAILKGGAMDQLIRDVTQIGVDEIIPLYTARSEVRLDPRRVKDKLNRWQQVAVESCKQCGNPWLPGIHEPVVLEDFVASSTAGLVCCASLETNAGSLRAVISGDLPPSITWLIGPEGDFSSEEYVAIASAGIVPVRLSAQILRAETAAVYALAITEYELTASPSTSSGQARA